MDTIRKSKTQNLIAGLAVMLISGILYMWSVFQPYVMAHFGWSSGQVGMTSSLMIACFVIGNVLAGGDFTGVFILCAVPVVLMLILRRFCLTHGGKKI